MRASFCAIPANFTKLVAMQSRHHLSERAPFNFLGTEITLLGIATGQACFMIGSEFQQGGPGQESCHAAKGAKVTTPRLP